MVLEFQTFQLANNLNGLLINVRALHVSVCHGKIAANFLVLNLLPSLDPGFISINNQHLSNVNYLWSMFKVVKSWASSLSGTCSMDSLMDCLNHTIPNYVPPTPHYHYSNAQVIHDQLHHHPHSNQMNLMTSHLSASSTFTSFTFIYAFCLFSFFMICPSAHSSKYSLQPKQYETH